MSVKLVYGVDLGTLQMGQKLFYYNKDGTFAQSAEIVECLRGGTTIYAKDKNGVEYTNNSEMYQNLIEKEQEKQQNSASNRPQMNVKYMTEVNLNTVQVGQRMQFRGPDGNPYLSSRISEVKTQNGNIYVKTASGSIYSNDKDYVARHNSDFEYQKEWADYIAQIAIDTGKTPKELAGDRYTWIEGTPPKIDNPQPGMTLEIGQLEPGMRIAISATNFIDTKYPGDKQALPTAAITNIVNTASNGQRGYIETHNSIYYNISGISQMVSQSIEELRQEIAQEIVR